MNNTTANPIPPFSLSIVSVAYKQVSVALDGLVIGFVTSTPLGFNAANVEGTRARPGIPTFVKAVEALVHEHQSSL